MAKLINAKCPNCGATLELPANLDRAFCIHCGGKVIIAKDIHYHGGKTAIACPECEGKGYFVCSNDKNKIDIKSKDHFKHMGEKDYWWAAKCDGSGECTVNQSKKVSLAGEIISFKKHSHNDKICILCNGKGKTGLQKCRLCNGSGICPVCKGKGKCSFCNGEGKIKCKTCNGTGFKVYQEE